MKIAVRRRIAAAVVLPLVAVGIGATVMATSGSAAVLSVSYDTSPFNDRTVTISFVTDGDDPFDPNPIPIGSTVQFHRSGTSGTTTDDFYSRVDDNASPFLNEPVTTVDLSDPEAQAIFAGDGRVNPGTYDVSFFDTDPRDDTPANQATRLDGCNGCVAVLSPGAPTMTKLTPDRVAAGATNITGTLTGTNLARGTTVQVQPVTGNTATDVKIVNNGAVADGDELDVRITVPTAAPGGVRNILLTNTDGQTFTCTGCFTVLGQNLTSVSPLRATNNDSDNARTITFSGPAGTVAGDAVPQLDFVGNPGVNTRESLNIPAIPGTVTRGGDGTFITAQFNLAAAAPGNNAYQPSITSPSTGALNLCTCRFSIDQNNAPTVTNVSPAAQDRGTTQVVTIGGTNFAKGTNVTVVGGGVTTTKVEYVSRTQLKATFSVTPAAAAGKRDVKVDLSDLATQTTHTATCTACYTINGNSPSPSASGTSTASPTPSCTPASGSASPSNTASPSATASATASSTASPTSTATPTASSTASPTATSSSTASPTATATASSTASPTATASSTASASSTATASSTASPNPCVNRRTATLRVEDNTVPAGSTARLFATGQPNEAYSLQCYSRPSTEYKEARSGSFNAAGDPVAFTVSLGRNTRCFLRYATNTTQGASPSVVINVNTVLSLSTVRQATRTYLFQGRNLPRVAGQLITLYRVDAQGREIRTSNLTTDDSGIYRVQRKFTGTGTFRFRVRTSQTINNAAGVSNTINVTVR